MPPPSSPSRFRRRSPGSPSVPRSSASISCAQKRSDSTARGWWSSTLGAMTSLAPVELLTYAAAITTRMKLGSAVLLTALHSPVHLAKSLATLDQLSGGRLIAGVGLGGNATVYPAHGLSGERRAARFAEGIGS